MPALGDAFFFAVDRSHLWVVITNPDGERREFVMVNLTTLDEKIFDESCVLGPVDYPVYITHPTVVYYIDAKLWWTDGENGFDELAAGGQIIPMDPLSKKTLLRVQQGALKSDFFTPDYKPMVQDGLVVIPISKAPPPRAVASVPRLKPPPPPPRRS